MNSGNVGPQSVCGVVAMQKIPVKLLVVAMLIISALAQMRRFWRIGRRLGWWSVGRWRGQRTDGWHWKRGRFAERGFNWGWDGSPVACHQGRQTPVD
jgi:hypothetical protein